MIFTTFESTEESAKVDGLATRRRLFRSKGEFAFTWTITGIHDEMKRSWISLIGLLGKLLLSMKNGKGLKRTIYGRRGTQTIVGVRSLSRGRHRGEPALITGSTIA